MAQTRSQTLAHPAFFSSRSRHDRLLFAEMPAGEDRLHGVIFDSDGRRLACTCDFRPRPCLHARALEALYNDAGDAAFEPIQALPDWVTALLDGRPTNLPTRPAVDRAAERANRRFDRLETAANGLDDLDTWLHDTLRRGLATAVAEEPDLFANIAGRLADAKLTALSRQFRLLAERVATGPGWEEPAVAQLAETYFTLRAFGRRDALPETLLYDLEGALGISLRKEDVLKHDDTVTDVWAVLGQSEETLEHDLRQRRTWLYGGRSKRYALLLEYEFGGSFAPGLASGGVVQATFAFYPGAWPLRALLITDAVALPKTVEKLPGHAALGSALDQYAEALGRQPWLAAFPMALLDIRPYRVDGRFYGADAAGQSVALEVAELAGWQLVALSGGSSVSLFGEWRDGALRVLAVVCAGRYVAF